MPPSRQDRSGKRELSLEHREDLELLRRAVEAGLLPADEMQRAENDNSVAESLLEALAGDGPSINAQRGIAGYSENSVAPAQDTSPGVLSPGADTQPNSPESVTLPGLPDRYQHLRQIGGGGMGQVFMATDTKLKRQVAIKILKIERDGATWTQMMRRESEVLARLSHPGIVPVFDVGQLADASPYIVMQFVEGQDLDNYVAAKQLGWRDLVSLVMQVAEAVGHAHLVSIVHRDIKPRNIRINSNGKAIVLDFGIAKPVGMNVESEPELVPDEPWKPSYESLGLGGAGTPAYMSPEQARYETVDLRTDVYALGVLMYVLLSGRLPWEPAVYADRLLLIDTIARQIPPRLKSPHYRIPRDLAAIVQRCLAGKPEERYANARELAAELGRLLDGKPVETYAKKRPWYVLRKFAVRNRVPVVGFSLAILAALFATMAGFSVRANRLELALSEERRKSEVVLRKSEAEIRDSFLHRISMKTATADFRLGQLGTASEALNETPLSRANWETAHLGLRTGSGIAPSATLSEHEYEVLDGAVSADRRFMATTGLEGQVLVWDLGSDRLHARLRKGEWCAGGLHWRHSLGSLPCCPPLASPRDRVLRLAWLKDNRRLVGVSWQGQVVVWDLETKGESVVYQHPQPLVALVAANDGTIMAGDYAGKLLVGTVESPASLKPVELDGACVSDLAAFADGRWCVGRVDGELTILDAQATQILRRETVPGPIWDLATDDQESLLVIAPNESRVALLDLRQTAVQVSPTAIQWLAIPTGSRDSNTVPHTVTIDVRQDRIIAGDSSGHVTFWSLANRSPELQTGSSGSGPTGDLTAQPIHYQRRLSVVATSRNGEGLWTSGADTVVRRWNVGRERFRNTIQMGENPHSVFDRQHPEWLWVASGRELGLLDSWTGERLGSVEVSGGETFNGISAAAQVPRIATCAGRTIHFWSSIEQPIGETNTEASAKIGRDGTEIQHHTLLRTIVLSPSGARVAAYDENNRVVLWDVATGTRIAERSLSVQADVTEEASYPVRPTLGVMGFNADGSQLLVCGPEQSPFLLSGDTLNVIRQPGVASGLGATAIAWHPRDSSHFIVGDTAGGVRSEPASRTQLGDASQRSSEVRGISFTSDGSRLAVISVRGEIVVIDPVWKDAGSIYSFSSDHAHAAKTSISSLEFDPTGRRLLVTHVDGMLEIWESQQFPIQPAPPESEPGLWVAKELDFKPHGTEAIRTRCQAITLDAEDRIATLFLGIRDRAALSAPLVTEDIPHTDRVHGRVVIGRESGSMLSLDDIDDLGIASARSITALHSSLALRCEPHTKKLLATYSRPTVGQIDYVRQLMLYDSRKSAKDLIQPVEEPANLGIDSSLLLDHQGRVLISHFLWSRYLSVVTRVAAAEPPTTFTMGRQGDFPAVVAIDSRGWLHSVGLPKRWPGDPAGRLEYRSLSDLEVDFSWDDHLHQSHETIANDLSPVQNWLTLDQQDRPTVTFSSNSGRDRWSAARARLHYGWRESTGWKHEMVLDRTVQWSSVSNHVELADGRVQLAFIRPEGDSLEIHLATRQDGSWRTELVHTIPGDESQTQRPGIAPLTLHIDSRHSPVIAGVLSDQKDAKLLVLRPIPDGAGGP